MPNPEIIRIDEIEAGTTLRVVLRPIGWKYRQQTNGLMRKLENQDPDPINERDWRRIVGLGLQRFIATVVRNDVDDRQLVLEFVDSKTNKRTAEKVRYRVNLPYANFFRLSRLVPQSREFASNEDELAFRREHRQSNPDKNYFDPKDRFVAVQLLAVVEQPGMVVNFTHQVASTDDEFIVELPEDMFEDADYTVVCTYNTVVGANVPVLAVPELLKTAEEFTVVSITGDTVTAGTTIDFHVKQR